MPEKAVPGTVRSATRLCPAATTDAAAAKTGGKLERPHSSTETREKHILKVSEDCPHIDMTIGTHPFRPLLDTGSQVSIVSDEFVKLLDPQLVRPAPESNVTLISATGHALKSTKKVKIRITLGKVRMYHDFIVVADFKHDMILGMDFMNSRRALLDFEHQRVRRLRLHLRRSYQHIGSTE